MADPKKHDFDNRDRAHVILDKKIVFPHEKESPWHMLFPSHKHSVRSARPCDANSYLDGEYLRYIISTTLVGSESPSEHNKIVIAVFLLNSLSDMDSLMLIIVGDACFFF